MLHLRLRRHLLLLPPLPPPVPPLLLDAGGDQLLVLAVLCEGVGRDGEGGARFVAVREAVGFAEGGGGRVEGVVEADVEEVDFREPGSVRQVKVMNHHI